MPVKTTQNKTSKYSNVVKSVKDTQPKEEPRIRPEQVIAAFKSFGFEPNQRNHNDIGYWVTKGQSEGAKLMDELHKRRSDINAKDDEDKKTEDDRRRTAQKAEDDKKTAHETLVNKQNVDKTAMPRLSDNDIHALYDEYGLPSPDPEWARNHLPNDPKKIRSILDMQRKMADDMIKKHTKNAVNSIPEVPKAGNQQGNSLPSGRGGPIPTASTGAPASGPISMQGGIADSTPQTNPFFVGDHSIVRIANPNNPNSSTTWLVDAKKKVLRPFTSDKAFQNAFEDPQEAEKSITNISSSELGPGGALDGFKPLKANQGVKEDGSMDKIDFSPAQIQSRYGKPSNPTAENKSLSILDGFLGHLNKKQQ